MYSIPFHTKSLKEYSFLVTGGAGFIGSNIVEYLLKYDAKKVVVLDDLSTGFIENIEPYINHPNVRFIQGSICDEKVCKEACQGIDFILHQAALGSVPRSIENPLATNSVNVSGFLNILVAAKDAKVKRIIYASSSSVYGDSKTLPKDEAVIGKPLSPYAVSKLTNELYADIFAKVYRMQITGLRYFNIFGPRQNPEGPYAAAIPLFINALMNNKAPVINGDGEQTRDFTFVENAVQANIKAAFADYHSSENKIYNVAVGERVSINQLFNILKKYIGSAINPIYGNERMGDVRDSLADISKAKKYLEYQPMIKTQEGLQITMEWFKKRFPEVQKN